jgi:hypothetical protein
MSTMPAPVVDIPLSPSLYGDGGVAPLATGTDLTDADQTLQPFADKASRYRMLAGVRTLSRTKTLGVTSAFAGLRVHIIDYHVGAETLAITNGGTHVGTLFTTPASHTKPLDICCYCNGVDWILDGVEELSA